MLSSASMRLVSFGPPGEERPGALIATRVVDLMALDPSLPQNLRDILRAGRLEGLKALLATPRSLPPWSLRDLAEVRLGPPLTNPSKIVCLGLNYLDHAREQGKELPAEPLLFAKAPSALAGPRDAIPLPPGVDHVDAEAELAFVMARRARRVSEAEAMDYVAGYMALNDVSARKLQRADGQWFRAKSFDGFAPCGPALVTCDEIADPHALALGSAWNGVTRQASSTAQLARRIPFLIAYISAAMTLEAGDIVSTGTPAGVGVFADPPVFLKAGDEVVITLEGVGELRNRVVDAR